MLAEKFLRLAKLKADFVGLTRGSNDGEDILPCMGTDVHSYAYSEAHIGT